jgi:hypothetical protein
MSFTSDLFVGVIRGFYMGTIDGDRWGSLAVDS